MGQREAEALERIAGALEGVAASHKQATDAVTSAAQQVALLAAAVTLKAKQQSGDPLASLLAWVSKVGKDKPGGFEPPSSRGGW